MSVRVATTQWSEVLAAREGTDTRARAALEGLCQTYWVPLYAFVRHQGHGPEEARDLTQGYFAELLEKDLLSEVDPVRGRFRDYLLATLRHFLSHERDRRRALKRGGGVTTLSLDVEKGERGYASRPVDGSTPEEVYERRWAITVLDRAMERLEADSREAGRAGRFRALRPYLTSAEPQGSYGEAAAALGMREGAVRTAVHRLRKRYGECLRVEISQTVADPAETDEELRHLLTVVGS